MTLYERYTTGDVVHSNIYGVIWDAQSFTVGNTGANKKHKVTSVKLRVFREGSPGTFTVGIRTIDGEGKPSDDELCSVDYDGNTLPESMAWVEFTFVSPATLLPSTQYTIVARAPGGDVDNHVSWRLDTTGAYTGGCNAVSDDGGDTWVLYEEPEDSRDLMFEEYGHPVGVIRLGTSIVLPSVGAIIPTSDGAEQKQIEGTNHSYYVLAFDKTTVEKADWQFLMPSSYDEGNVLVQIYWVATPVVGGVVYDVNFGHAGDSDSSEPALTNQACAAVTPHEGVVSPTGSEVTTWSGPGYAYDDNEDTHASSGIINSTLVLTHSPLTCSRIRYLAAKTLSEQVKIRIYKDGAWETIFEGDSGLGWQTKTFTSGQVTKAEISFTEAAAKYFYEFDFGIDTINISSCTLLTPFNAGEYAIIRIHRETGDGSDTMDGDAEIIGVILQWV